MWPETRLPRRSNRAKYGDIPHRPAVRSARRAPRRPRLPDAGKSGLIVDRLASSKSLWAFRFEVDWPRLVRGTCRRLLGVTYPSYCREGPISMQETAKNEQIVGSKLAFGSSRTRFGYG